MQIQAERMKSKPTPKLQTILISIWFPHTPPDFNKMMNNYILIPWNEELTEKTINLNAKIEINDANMV